MIQEQQTAQEQQFLDTQEFSKLSDIQSSSEIDQSVQFQFIIEEKQQVPIAQQVDKIELQKYKKPYLDLRKQYEILKQDNSEYKLKVQRLEKSDINNQQFQQNLLNSIALWDGNEMKINQVELNPQQEQLNNIIHIKLKKLKEQADNEINKLNKIIRSKKDKILHLKQMNLEENKPFAIIRQDLLDDIILEYDKILSSKLLPGALTSYNRQFDIKYQEKDNQNIILNKENDNLKHQLQQINQEALKIFKKDFYIQIFSEIKEDQNQKITEITKNQQLIKQLQITLLATQQSSDKIKQDLKQKSEQYENILINYNSLQIKNDQLNQEFQNTFQIPINQSSIKALKQKSEQHEKLLLNYNSILIKNDQLNQQFQNEFKMPINQSSIKDLKQQSEQYQDLLKNFNNNQVILDQLNQEFFIAFQMPLNSSNIKSIKQNQEQYQSLLLSYNQLQISYDQLNQDFQNVFSIPLNQSNIYHINDMLTNLNQFQQQLSYECKRFFDLQLKQETFEEIKKNHENYKKQIIQLNSQIEHYQQSQDLNTQDKKVKFLNQENLKSIQKIKQLEKQIEDYENQIKTYGDQQEEIKNQENKIKQLKCYINNLEIKITYANKDLQFQLTFCEDLKKSNEIQKQELGGQEQLLHDNKDNIQKLQLSLNDSNNKIQIVQQENKQLQQEYQHQREQILKLEFQIANQNSLLENQKSDSNRQYFQQQQIKQLEDKIQEQRNEFFLEKQEIQQQLKIQSKELTEKENQIQKHQLQMQSIENNSENQTKDFSKMQKCLNEKIIRLQEEQKGLELKNRSSQQFIEFMGEKITLNLQKLDKIQPLYSLIQDLLYKKENNQIIDPFDDQNISIQDDKYIFLNLECNKDIIRDIILFGYPPNFQQIIKINQKAQSSQMMQRSINPNQISSYFKGYFIKYLKIQLKKPLSVGQNQSMPFQNIHLRPQNNKIFIIREEKYSTYTNKLQEVQGLVGNYYLIQYFLQRFNQELQMNNLNFPPLELPQIQCIQKQDSEIYYYIEESIMNSNSQNNNSQQMLYLNALKYFSYFHSKKQYMITEINIYGNLIYDAIISSKYQLLSSYDQGNQEILQQF